MWDLSVTQCPQLNTGSLNWLWIQCVCPASCLNNIPIETEYSLLVRVYFLLRFPCVCMKYTFRWTTVIGYQHEFSFLLEWHVLLPLLCRHASVQPVTKLEKLKMCGTSISLLFCYKCANFLKGITHKSCLNTPSSWAIITLIKKYKMKKTWT